MNGPVNGCLQLLLGYLIPYVKMFKDRVDEDGRITVICA
jgi:hypothetical protein